MFNRKTRTPEYQLVGDETAVFETSKGAIPRRAGLRGRSHPCRQFLRARDHGLLRWPQVPPLRSRFRHPGRLPQHARHDVRAGRRRAARPDGQPGTGGPGWCIKEEFSTNPRNSHVDGALAMARSMDPNSAGSQFYFCLGPQHNLDSGYTVFGSTLEGQGRHLRASRRGRDRERRDRPRGIAVRASPMYRTHN